MMRVLAAVLVWSASYSARADGHLVAVASSHGFENEAVLRYAGRDARAVRNVLKQFGLQQPLHEHLLLEPSATELLQTIRRLGLKPEDSLYVYYSGHAGLDGLHLGATLLDFNALRDAVESVRARVKLLILDACRSGKITRIKGARPARPFPIELQDRLNIAGTAIISSSSESEDSQESDDLRASFFTFHFLQGLRGAADRDQDRLVTLSEAFRYASNATLRSTAETDALQHPTYTGRFFGQGSELVLSRLDGKASASATLVLPESGLYLLFDAHDQLYAEITVEEATAHYLVPAGKWLIQRRRAGEAEEQWVQLAAGEERTISARDASLVRLTRLDAKGRADDGYSHRLQVLESRTAKRLP